jgi:hypothetical protein
VKGQAPEALRVSVHVLKCWPRQFDAIWHGNKRHEIRKADRAFEARDCLVLREWVPGAGRFTGRDMLVRVTYIDRGPEWGLPEGLVVMSIDTVGERR